MNTCADSQLDVYSHAHIYQQAVTQNNFLAAIIFPRMNLGCIVLHPTPFTDPASSEIRVKWCEFYPDFFESGRLALTVFIVNQINQLILG